MDTPASVRRNINFEDSEEDRDSVTYERYHGGGSSKMNGMRHSHRKASKGKLAELFRKDLISAMKLADTEQLHEDDYVLISDTWRQEWERGVQVPINPSSIRNATVKSVSGKEKVYGMYGFKLPKKFLHGVKDDNYHQGIHELHETQKMAEQVCRYDLDDLDVAWLQRVNEERIVSGDLPIEEWVMEKVVEEIEAQCHVNMQAMIKTVEGLGIEYDENIMCDVCRSPESEDTNEMVFCDNCDICVHQACYGISKIPEGSWLCRTCVLGIRPTCILCPNSGGAMKSTKSGTKWAHVSCALWIPEVSIGCPEKMEPVTKISQIPSSRWSLVCSVCRERSGACIQCSVKTCKTAFHVSCGFKNNLEMRTSLDKDGEDVKLQGYCVKHSKRLQERETGSFREDCGVESPRKELTEAEKSELRSHRLHKVEEEFYTCVKVDEVAEALKVPEDEVDFIHNYWILKRKSNFNKPLLTPKTEEADLLSKQREDSLLARMKMFVHLRQDLERVRNLCYMVSKREKIRKQLYKMKEEIFKRQKVAVLKMTNCTSAKEKQFILKGHRSTEIYDDYDEILAAAARGIPEDVSFNIQTFNKLKEERERGKSSKGKRPIKGNLEHGITREPVPETTLSGEESASDSKRTSFSPTSSTASKACAEASTEPKNIFTVMTRGGRVAKRISLIKGEMDNVGSKSQSENEVSDDCRETKSKTPVLRHSKQDFHGHKEKDDSPKYLQQVKNTPKNQDVPNSKASSRKVSKNTPKDSLWTEISTPKELQENSTPRSSRSDRKRRYSESTTRETRSRAEDSSSENSVKAARISTNSNTNKNEKSETNSSGVDADTLEKEQICNTSEASEPLLTVGEKLVVDEKPKIGRSPDENKTKHTKVKERALYRNRKKRWSEYNTKRISGRDRLGKFSGGNTAPLRSQNDTDSTKETIVKIESASTVPNGIVQNSKFVVGQSIKEKVQSKLHKARLKANLTNGVHNAVEKLVKRETGNDSTDSKTLEYLDTDLMHNKKEEVKCEDGDDNTKEFCKQDIESNDKMELDTNKSEKESTTVSDTEQKETIKEKTKQSSSNEIKCKKDLGLEVDSNMPEGDSDHTNTKIKNEERRTKSVESTPSKSKHFSDVASLSPTGILGGYRIPKKSPDSQTNNDIEHRTPLSKRLHPEENLVAGESPETRSAKRSIDADMDVNDSVFDNADGEISIKSSRSTTPDREMGPVRRSGRHSLERQVSNKLQSDIRSKSCSLASNSDVDIDSENDCALSDSNANLNLTEAGNSQSSSTSNCSSKSRVSDQWSRSLRSVSS